MWIKVDSCVQMCANVYKCGEWDKRCEREMYVSDGGDASNGSWQSS